MSTRGADPGATPATAESTDATPATTESLDAALRAGERVLHAAGVPSARADVELLAAHLLRGTRSDVRTAAVLGRPAPEGLDALVARRAQRVPLQHLTGRAPFRRIELEVGPGVFVPRPETEQVAEVAVAAARAAAADRATPGQATPGQATSGQATSDEVTSEEATTGGAASGQVTGHVVVVDLCTGSGAIALAVADEVPQAQVHAVELDARAHAWAARNVAASSARERVHLVRGDARTALTHLDGLVDVVVSNPPYVPPDAVPVDPEVRDHDPAVALYGLGPDGLTVPRGVAAAAARLLRAGGLLVMEHAEVQAAAARALVLAVRAGDAPAFADVRTAQDLSGRDRMVVARRSPAGGAVTVKDSRP